MKGGWYQIDDSEGLCFTLRRPKVRTAYPLPGSNEELCALLNQDENWNLHDTGRVMYRSHFPEEVKNEVYLPSGTYFFEQKYGDVECLRPLAMREDELVRVPGLTGAIVDDVRRFLGNESKYRAMGIQYRIGILLYGAPGNGKTLLIRDIIKNELPSDAVVMFLSTLPTTAFLQGMKRTLKDRLKVLVFEELNAVVKNSRIEQILDFLDGETSLDKTLIFATTNYPELLPGNLVERPSRFDKVYEIGEPDEESRTVILQFFLKRTPTIDEVTRTKGLSSADLKEVVLLNQVQELVFYDAVNRIKSHHKLVEKNFADRVRIGIANDNE